MKRRTLLTLSVAAMAVGVAGCNANPRPTASSSSGGVTNPVGTTTTPVKGGTLTILSTSKEIHFDPAMSQNLATSGIHYITRGLTTWKTDPSADTTLVADLATDTGKTSDGGKTWTFTLQSGLTYSDGSPIKAADIKFGVERSFDEQLQGGLSYHKVLLEGAANYTGPAKGQHLDSIETPDDVTIIFHLVRPFADWPWITSMPAFSPIPSDKGMGIPAYDHTPPSSGPYMVSDYKVGQGLTLVRNPNWKAETDPNRPAWPDVISYQMGLNPQTAAQRMAADTGTDKNATGPTVDSSLITKINSDPALKARVYVSPSGPINFLVINNEKITDLAVRQAINYAINKQSIQTLAGGPTYGGSIATTLLPPGVIGHTEFDLYPAPPTGDPAKAKELLAGKTVPSLSLVIDSSDPATAQKANSVVNDLKAVGITVTISSLDSEKANDVVTKTGDFHLAFGGWQADYPSAYAALQPLFDSSQIGNGNYNQARFSSADVDKAIQAASAEVDAAKGAELWGAIDKQIMTAAAVVPLLYSKNSFIYGSNVGGSYVPSFPAYTNALQQGLRAV